ncbi:acyl-CoA thioesterase [Aeromicrobium wangtongii]|uniref:Thioesterase family protein n=1 Tax=Aeromicrobium wangtongii TaxID=2969247 RepID=A0ABY5M8K0_9ACTN|nr:acyl-CoA thioesterase domain-containing protein [Aeromicrobium wangtongii]MCD9196959.1 thioesterase family protein [Aeromicrobium wangtongii]UUP14464.1 thioesterase family protein [Aeromicrobium wangtongii]
MTETWSQVFPTVKVDDEFVASAPLRADGSPRSFGGHLTAIAVSAAGQRFASHLPHSVHGYYLRPVLSGSEIAGRLVVLGEGRQVSRCQVTLSVSGKLVYVAVVSLHAPQEIATSDSDQLVVPAVPSPSETEPLELFPTAATAAWFEQRPVSAEPMRIWVRSAQPLPADPWTSYAAIASMTDIGLVRAADPAAAQDVSDEHGQPEGVTLEHALWFHQRPDAASWNLLDATGIRSSDGRALAQGRLWSQDGTLSATFVQDVLARPAKSQTMKGAK